MLANVKISDNTTSVQYQIMIFISIYFSKLQNLRTTLTRSINVQIFLHHSPEQTRDQNNEKPREEMIYEKKKPVCVYRFSCKTIQNPMIKLVVNIRKNSNAKMMWNF